MEIFIFFGFIAVCAFALVWASRKTRSETELASNTRRKRNEARSEKLKTPRDSLLAHNDQVWQSRRQNHTTGVEAVNRFVPKSLSDGSPEYDGFSRRDRHHVYDRRAQVKEEHEEEFTMTAVEFRSDPDVPDKATG
jgi:hypothetical protein